jgi:hypothetical protein
MHIILFLKGGCDLMEDNNKLIFKDKTIDNKSLKELLEKKYPKKGKTFLYEKVKQLIDENIIYRIDAKHFSTVPRKQFDYNLTKPSLKICSKMEQYGIEYVIWESDILNYWLNHLLNKNYVFIEVDKKYLDFAFDYLTEKGFSNILVNPSLKEFNKYRNSSSVIIIPLFSKSPVEHNKVTIEKIIVDLYVDKIFSNLIESSELPAIYNQIFKTYKINFTTLYSYAKRRRVYDNLKAAISSLREVSF